MIKIDKIYIETAFNNDGNHTVVTHFDDGSTDYFHGIETISDAIDIMDKYKQKYGSSEAHEKHLIKWANFSEGKHPMDKHSTIK